MVILTPASISMENSCDLHVPENSCGLHVPENSCDLHEILTWHTLSSVITPYFMEEVKFSDEELHSNQDETSTLSYMQKIYPGHIYNETFFWLLQQLLAWFIWRHTRFPYVTKIYYLRPKITAHLVFWGVKLF